MAFSATQISRLVVAGALVIAMGGATGQPISVRDRGDTAGEANANSVAPGGPFRLKSREAAEGTGGPDTVGSGYPSESGRRVYVTSEFERFLRTLSNQDVHRLGAELVTTSGDIQSDETTATVPPNYVVAPGDEVLVVAWGSVDADLRLIVDRGGRITVPRVGVIQVGGVRYDQLAAVVEGKFAQVFRNFQVSVSMGRLRGIRVFVTGYVVNPGTYSVSPLSTVLGAMMRAGGPTSSGSFRKLELKRGAVVVARVDLYDLLLKGDNTADRLLQSGDVVHVGPVGKQVGVIGSVNRPSVVELADNEGVEQALGSAGGFSALAERDRLTLERIRARTEKRVVQITLPTNADMPLEDGDVLRAYSAALTVVSTVLQNKRVRIDGEVARPGAYILPPQSTLQDAIKAAGGLSESAYLYGTQFTRQSVRATQQENYDRALRDLETDFARSAGTQLVTSGEQEARVQFQSAAAARLIERLRALKPSGRVVLQIAPNSHKLPDLTLEDGDNLYVPPTPTTVGVFGSVFNSGSYLFGDGRAIGDYLRLAGGPTKGADEDSIFIVRSNGQVISERQSRGNSWFSHASNIGKVQAEPGDTVFVPEEMDKTTFLQAAKDWTQVLYQFGIGIAGITNALR